MYVLIFHLIGVKTKHKVDEIKLAHFSIKEYLLSEYVKEHHDKKVKAFSLSHELSHSMISQTCLIYLLQFKTPKQENHADFSLMEYAAKNWIFHVQSSNDDNSQECTLSKLMMRILTPDNPAFVNWVEIYDPQNASEHLPPQYYTCKAGLIKITDSLLKNGVDVNRWVKGKYGHALQVASSNGHEAIAKILIENGADVNAQGGHYGNALQAASSEGYEAIAKLLIENGADVNAQGGLYGNALQAASYRGQEAIAKLLIENGADVNAQGGEYGSTLQAALFWGHEATAKLLIENGADVNAQGGEYENALQVAAYEGHEAIAKLLIENGADVNAQGGLYGNALQAASSEGYEAIAKLLIENGADVNAQGGCFGNALHAALTWGNKTIAKLLIQNGADVDA